MAILIKKEYSIDELAIKEEKLSYARKKGENKAIEELQIKRRKRKHLTIAIVLAIISTYLCYDFKRYLNQNNNGNYIIQEK